jgi:hypothetical protein
MVAPVFIDAAGAAEILRLPIERVLDLVAEGRLKTYGGKAGNPFVRSADVTALVQELGVGVADEESPRRVKSGAARVQTRLTADSRWSDIEETDIRDWVGRADQVKRQAARTSATIALNRLQLLLQAIDEVDR